MTELLHGDCYEILPTLGKCDCVITDPPYEFNAHVTGRGMFADSNAERYGRKRHVGNLERLEEVGSTTFSPGKFLDLLEPRMERFCGYFFCNKTLVADYIEWARKRKYTYDILVMLKRNPVPAHSTHHVSDTEYIILIRGKGCWFQGQGLELDDYRKWYMTTCGKRVHPAEKPVELLERFVRTSVRPGGTVLDPFMGSGSTAIAALKNGRNFVGIEKADEYFSLAKERVDGFNCIGGLFEGIA